MAQDQGSLLRTWLLPFIAPTPSAQKNMSHPLEAMPGKRKESIESVFDGHVVEMELDVLWAVQPSAGEQALHPPGSEVAPRHFGGRTGIGVLRERGAVLLLYSLAKLYQAGQGWETAVTHPDVQGVIEALLDHISGMTLQLDAQVGGARLLRRQFSCLSRDACPFLCSAPVLGAGKDEGCC
jgi:hypothetical protein